MSKASKKEIVFLMVFLVLFTHCSTETVEPEPTLQTSSEVDNSTTMTATTTSTVTPKISLATMTSISTLSGDEVQLSEPEVEQTPTVEYLPSPQVSNNFETNGLWVFVAISLEKGNNPDLYFWNNTTQVLEPLAAGSDTSLSYPTFSPDCERLAYFVQEGEDYAINIVNIHTQESKLIVVGTVVTSSLAWSPNGENIAYISGDFSENEITIVNINNGKTDSIKLPTAGRMPDWSPDGQTILFTSIEEPLSNSSLFSHQITVYDLLEDKFIDLIAEPVSGTYTLDNPTRYGYWQPRWSPNGELIAMMTRVSTELGRSVSRIYLMTNEGTEIRPITISNKVDVPLTSAYLDHSPSWSSNGQEVSFVRDFEFSPDVWQSQVCRVSISDPENSSCLQLGEIEIITADYCSP